MLQEGMAPPTKSSAFSLGACTGMKAYTLASLHMCMLPDSPFCPRSSALTMASPSAGVLRTRDTSRGTCSQPPMTAFVPE